MKQLQQAIKGGFGFGLTSGVITTLGLLVGLHSGTHSKTVVIGGILVIAVADALSDALGMHVSEESENEHSPREIWKSTLSTLLSKLFIALTFILPVILFPLSLAIISSVIWGLLLIAMFSYFIAREEHQKPLKVILEHLSITILVVIVTHYIGDWVANFN